jgi:cell division protein FtsI/penicillin-binding protein 2
MHPNGGSPKRLRLLSLGFLALGMLIIGQLFRIQVLSHGFYAALAEGQHDLFKRLFPQRGRIYAQEKDGQRFLLATNQKLALLYAEPFRIEDPKGTAAKLAPLIEADPKELAEKLSNKKEFYRALKKQVDDDLKGRIEALALTGIRFSSEDYRYYPEQTSAAQVLGFVGTAEDGRRSGRYGVEGYFDKELAGEQGFLESEKDPLGRLIAVGRREMKPAKDGDDVILTIDRTIEHVVCGKLDDWVLRHGASRGSVIVMTPSTGAIVAICNAPAFDPNAYNKVDDINVYNDTAIFDAYEPGSIFKTFTMAAGLDSGKIVPSTPFTDPGEVKIGPHTIRNSDLKAHGLVDMTEVLAESLNTGVVEVAHRLGPETFLKYVRDFGFGDRYGIELQTESAGDIESLSRKGDIWSATGSFGQGITTTPLQIVAAYAAVANGGVLMKPYVVDEIVKADGTVQRRPPKMIRRVISERAAKLLSGMLVQVVERGHGKRAAVKGHWIGGKTGTAQIARSDGPGYEVGATIGSFAGFGPIDAPKFAMIVRVDRPKDVEFAESSAAPLFGDIAKFLLDYYEIPPTRK